MTFSSLSGTFQNEIVCISKIKSLLSEIHLENKYIFFVTTHFPSGNTEMKKVLLLPDFKINIWLAMDIPQITLINWNEKSMADSIFSSPLKYMPSQDEFISNVLEQPWNKRDLNLTNTYSLCDQFPQSTPHQKILFRTIQETNNLASFSQESYNMEN